MPNTNIADLYANMPGLKQDFATNWKETTVADWKNTWDGVAGPTNGVVPANTVLPVITGTASVGFTLTSSTGTWTGTPAPTYTYQWYAGATAISGATASTYVPVVGDVGAPITVRVRGRNGAGNGVGVTVTSAATTAVYSD